MIDIRGCNVTIMVSDMDTAIKFYTEILGLTLKNRYGAHWADIVGPGITIGLHPSDQEISRSDNLQIGLSVSNLEQAIEKLENTGIKFKKSEGDNVQLSTFQDPDGNTLYLIQTEEYN